MKRNLSPYFRAGTAEAEYEFHEPYGKLSTSAERPILLAFSGGADSAACAVLLKDAGWDVAAVYFRMLGNGCSCEESEYAYGLAEELGIPLIVKDVSEDFEQMVVSAFTEDYRRGITPNPCVECNPKIKFGSLISLADEMGIYHIATGHYARIISLQGKFFVGKAVSPEKDQSYMLYRVNSETLERTVFPLGELDSKNRVRKLLSSRIKTEDIKKDSQDICFIKEGSYKTFLFDRGFEPSEGAFVDTEGKNLGHHEGYWNFTVGQRKGLGLALGEPMYVRSLDYERNIVELGDEASIMQKTILLRDAVFTGYGESYFLPEEYEGGTFTAKIRYAATPVECRLHSTASGIIVDFIEPQRAPAPGQSAVIYAGDRVIGGGFIS